MKVTSAILALGLLASGSIAARADSEAPAPGAAQYEGTYDRQGTDCAYASQVSFSEETDPTTDIVSYHLRLLRGDGRVWDSREFRQLNGLPWYKADMGNDGTVSGRSRFACTGADCTLWNERKTCKGLVFPRCSGWVSGRQDEVVFGDSVLTLFTDTDGVCTFVRR